MQWNQPFGNSDFQSYLKTVSPPTPQIVGEGDVTAITFPDGSVQFYFIPTTGQNQPTPCKVKNPYSNIFAYPINTELWFVRTIIHPQGSGNLGNINTQLPRTFKEYPPILFANHSPYEYIQKFHYDKWTSTTDIHYFYPSLRRAECLRFCTQSQTDISFPNNNFSHNGECIRPCHCEQSFRREPVNIGDKYCPQVIAKSSCMSVESLTNEPEQRKKCRTKLIKKSRHSCNCKGTRETSEKCVATYAEQATGNTATGGRETQTLTTKKRKPKVAHTNLIIKSSSSQSSSYSGSCTCSTVETGRS